MPGLGPRSRGLWRRCGDVGVSVDGTGSVQTVGLSRGPFPGSRRTCRRAAERSCDPGRCARGARGGRWIATAVNTHVLGGPLRAVIQWSPVSVSLPGTWPCHGWTASTRTPHPRGVSRGRAAVDAGSHASAARIVSAAVIRRGAVRRHVASCCWRAAKSSHALSRWMRPSAKSSTCRIRMCTSRLRPSRPNGRPRAIACRIDSSAR
jgi:hypothetical protein